jgi:replicative DNA helicase
MEESYSEYAKHIHGRKASTGIASFDKHLGGVRPNQIVTYIGGTNVGKTAIIMNNIRSNVDRFSDGLIILIEGEVDENEIFERSIQMEYDLYTYEVENAYLKNDTKLITEFKKIAKRFANVVCIIKRIHVDQIPMYVKAIEKFYNKPCRLLGIDYVGLLQNDYRDEYAMITYSMKKLKEINQGLQIPIINLSQTSRFDIKGENKKIGLYAGKGSGEVENSSQVVIALNRVTELPADQRITQDIMDKCLEQPNKKPSHYLVEAKIEKKKQGDYHTTYLLFNKKNLLMTDLDQVEDEPF